MKKSVLLLFFAVPLLLAARSWNIAISGKLTPQNAAEISKTGTAPAGSKKIEIKAGAAYPLYKLSGKITRGTPLRAIASTVINSESACERHIGIGADWYFTAFLNGKMVLTTEPGGNEFERISPYNHIAKVKLNQGANHLAIFIRPNVYQWKFAFKLMPEINMLPTNPVDRDRMIFQMLPPKNPGLLRKELLHQMSSDSTAVSCEFGVPTICGIRYRKKSDPAEKTQLIWNTDSGKRLLRNIHRFTLTGLDAASTYTYEIVTINTNIAKIIPVSSGSFTTFPAEGVEHSFIAVSDTQAMPENRMMAMKNLAKLPAARNSSFIVSLGDVSATFENFEPNYFDWYLNVLRKNNLYQPITLVKGNHEYRGNDAEAYPKHFGRSYYAFRHGEVFYIVLDTGEGADTIWEPGNHLLWTDTTRLFKEQIEFLDKIIDTPECRNAKYRIVLAHASPFKYHAKFYAGNVRKLVEKFFYGKNPRCSIDLWLCAHVHYASRFDPVTKTMVGYDTKSRSKKSLDSDDLADVNFPVVTNDGPGQGGQWLSFTGVKVTPDGLHVTIYTIDGKIIDESIIQKGKAHITRQSVLQPIALGKK